MGYNSKEKKTKTEVSIMDGVRVYQNGALEGEFLCFKTAHESLKGSDIEGVEVGLSGAKFMALMGTPGATPAAAIPANQLELERDKITQELAVESDPSVIREKIAELDAVETEIEIQQAAGQETEVTHDQGPPLSIETIESEGELAARIERIEKQYGWK